MKRFGTSAILISSAAILVTLSFQLPAQQKMESASSTDTKAEILTVIERQQSAWNAGDIPKFMETYWNNEQLTFCSGGDIQRGWQSTFDRYTARYPDRKTMGKLEFTELECELLGTEFAKVIGIWKLDRESPVSGRFTLILKNIKDQWMIIHDHTSSQS